MYQNKIYLIKALTEVGDRLIDRLIMMMRRRREKRKKKTAVCTNLKQTSTKCGATLCGVLYCNAGKNVIDLKTEGCFK